MAARAAGKPERLADKAANTNLGYQTLPDLAVQAQNKAPLDNLRRFLESFTGPVIFSVESEGRHEAFSDERWRGLKLRQNMCCVWRKPPATAAI
ncbi:hypothetical protein MJ565_10730 [Klebsiella pneumoniae]|nr:hypothetical protein MJ565_10730 [Klebsiella pneumoniae]